MLNDEEREQIRVIQNEYARQWRKNNPEKVQEMLLVTLRDKKCLKYFSISREIFKA